MNKTHMGPARRLSEGREEVVRKSAYKLKSKPFKAISTDRPRVVRTEKSFFKNNLNLLY
jgi:hypothetical protein